MGYIAIGNIEKEFAKVRREARREMTAALRWAIVHSLNQHPQTSHLAREALDRLPPLDGEEWMTEVLDTLVGLIARQHTEYWNQNKELFQTRKERDEMQQKVDEYEIGLLNERIASLTEERDRWRREAQYLPARVQELEEALARSQKARQFEVNSLQEEIAGLNRVVVRQQERIDAFHE